MGGAPGASAEAPPPPDAGTCSWVKANTGDISSDLVNVFALDASHLYTTGAPDSSGHAPLWATADGGTTWNDIAPPGQLGQHHGVAFLDVDHGVLTSPRRIWTTADGGNTWSHATPAPTPAPDSWSWTDVAYVDESHIWAVGSSGSGIGAVVFSSDGGATWTAQTSTNPTEVGLFGVDFVDATHGWAVGWGGVVLATSDGSTWQTQRPFDPEIHQLNDVDFVDSAHGWASGSGTVLATTDGGTTWTGQSPGHSSVLPGVGAATPRDAMVVTDNGHIRHTTDGGSTWTDTPTGQSEIFLGDIAMPDATHAVAAGSGGTILLGTCDRDLPVVLPRGGIAVEGNSGTSTLEVLVELSEPSGVPVSVDWSTVDTEQPTAGVDFEAASGTLVFAPGETSKTIPITVLGDTLDETGQLWGAEWGAVVFSTPVNATLAPGFGALALALIVDDDPPPTLLPGLGAVLEGDEGTTVMAVPVSLSAPSGNTVTVDWATGATVQPEPGVDFEAASGTVVFAPGETSKTIPVVVHGDLLDEPGQLWHAEWGIVTYSNPTNARFGQGIFAAAGLAVIVDDD